MLSLQFSPVHIAARPFCHRHQNPPSCRPPFLPPPATRTPFHVARPFCHHRHHNLITPPPHILPASTLRLCPSPCAVRCAPLPLCNVQSLLVQCPTPHKTCEPTSRCSCWSASAGRRSAAGVAAAGVAHIRPCRCTWLLCAPSCVPLLACVLLQGGWRLPRVDRERDLATAAGVGAPVSTGHSLAVCLQILLICIQIQRTVITTLVSHAWTRQGPSTSAAQVTGLTLAFPMPGAETTARERARADQVSGRCGPAPLGFGCSPLSPPFDAFRRPALSPKPCRLLGSSHGAAAGAHAPRRRRAAAAAPPCAVTGALPPRPARTRPRLATSTATGSRPTTPSCCPPLTL